MIIENKNSSIPMAEPSRIYGILLLLNSVFAFYGFICIALGIRPHLFICTVCLHSLRIIYKLCAGITFLSVPVVGFCRRLSLSVFLTVCSFSTNFERFCGHQRLNALMGLVTFGLLKSICGQQRAAKLFNMYYVLLASCWGQQR